MNAITAEILLLLVLLLLNGFFVMAEISILLSRKSKLKQKAEDGKKSYQKVLALAQHPGPFLSTMQVGITLIGILVGALGEKTLSADLEVTVSSVAFLAPWSELISFIVVVIGIALVSVFIGELVPKRIALSNPERIAASVVVPIRVFSLIFYPLERFLTYCTDAVLKVLGVKPAEDSPVTEEELLVMLREGREAGVFHEVEQNLVENVLDLDDKGTHGYLTPRIDVLFFEKDTPMEEVKRAVLDNPSLVSFPVCDSGLDNVIGVVECKRLLMAMAEGKVGELQDYLETPIFVPSSVSALKVLSVFKEKRVTMVLIVDEYGGIQGVMTIQNILERLFGEVVTQPEDTPQIIRREDGSYLVDGPLAFADFAKFFDVEKEWELEKGDYHTVAGFILKRMGRIPSAANYFVWKTFYFEVLDMDGVRVDKILVRRFEKKSKPVA
ncbi:MAG: hemolysin family protein [Spirochaetales bacterium]